MSKKSKTAARKAAAPPTTHQAPAHATTSTSPEIPQIDMPEIKTGLVAVLDILGYENLLERKSAEYVASEVIRVVNEAPDKAKGEVQADISPMNKIITEGKNGLLFAPEDSEDLAKKILLLLNNEALRKQLGSEARRMVTENFSVKKIMNQFQKLYTEMLN